MSGINPVFVSSITKNILRNIVVQRVAFRADQLSGQGAVVSAAEFGAVSACDAGRCISLNRAIGAPRRSPLRRWADCHGGARGGLGNELRRPAVAGTRSVSLPSDELAENARGDLQRLLVGVRRIRLLEELPPEKLFREARVEVLDDLLAQSRMPASRASDQARGEFPRPVCRCSRTRPSHCRSFPPADLVGNADRHHELHLDLGQQLKVQLLGEPRVETRAELLIKAAGRLLGKNSSGPRPKFPPEFSLN